MTDTLFACVVVMGTIELASYPYDYSIVFHFSLEQLPAELPPVIAAVPGH